MDGDDEDWSSFADPRLDRDTEIERPTLDEVAEEEAVPRPVPERDRTTGRYKTLQGYEVARETVERIAGSRGRTTERTFMMAALRFFLIDLGSNMAGADDLVQRFHTWVQQDDNRRLVETALGWDKNPP